VDATHFPAFVVERRSGLLDFWTVYERLIERAPDTALDVALRLPDFAALVRARRTGPLIEQVQRSRATLRTAITEGEWQPYIAETRSLGARYAELGVDFAAWQSVPRVFQQRLIPALVEAYAATPPRLTEALIATDDFLAFSTALVAEQFFETLRARDGGRRDLENMISALAGTTTDAIVTADHHGTITYVNHAAEALFGRPAGELAGQPLTVLMPERLREAHRKGLARYLASRATVVLGKTIEMPALRADGSERAVEMSIATWEASGKPAFAAIIRDVSERKRIEAALELRSHQLEDANRELEAFGYSVAHDLRAPLRAMSGFAQILVDDHTERLDRKGIGYLRKIQSTVRRMGALIDALFALSRLSRGELHRQSVDLSAMARSIVAQLAAAEPARAVEVTVEERLRANADPRMVRNLLENLIGNAWKFTGKTASPRIVVGHTEGGAFFVRDNGAGFDLVAAGKLFSPFERLHSPDDFPGSGIGLATVQRIVHRHGGRIWVNAQVNAGATFFFTLSPGEL
jgi:PAS domain S-box-containing protein